MSLSGLTFSSIPAPRSCVVMMRECLYVARRPQAYRTEHSENQSRALFGSWRRRYPRALRSNPVGGARHDAGGLTHEGAYRAWKIHSTGGPGIGAVSSLIRAHLLHDGAALQIAGRQAAEVLVEMTLDLPLRLHDEAEAGPIAGESGQRPDAERARIPQRVEEARAGFELPQPCLAPGEMVGLLASGIEQDPAGRLDRKSTRL